MASRDHGSRLPARWGAHGVHNSSHSHSQSQSAPPAQDSLIQPFHAQQDSLPPVSRPSQPHQRDSLIQTVHTPQDSFSPAAILPNPPRASVEDSISPAAKDSFSPAAILPNPPYASAKDSFSPAAILPNPPRASAKDSFSQVATRSNPPRASAQDPSSQAATRSRTSEPPHASAQDSSSQAATLPNPPHASAHGPSSQVATRSRTSEPPNTSTQQHEPSAYDQVKALIQDIKANKIEKYLVERRVFKIPAAQWYRLRREFDITDNERFPRYEYDTARSVLTFKEMPSAVHESVVDFLHQQFHRKISDEDLLDVTRRGQHLQEREYIGSEKIPDLKIVETKLRGGTTKWVLEVGFSEDEEKLQADMRLWLRGDSKVLRCVLVKIIEDPQYKCPLSKHMTDEEIEQQELKANVGMDEFQGEKYGPIFHTKHQHQWVGNIREIYMEVWKLDAAGEPERVGPRRMMHPIPDLPIQLDDILPDSILLECSELGDGPKSLSLNWDKFERMLENAVIEMAYERYCKWWEDCAKIRGESRKADPDYVD